MARPIQSMPENVQRQLAAAGLVDVYEQRLFYQRNDYLAWIQRAKRPETRQRRLKQMLEELERGGFYMGMTHRPSRSD